MVLLALYCNVPPPKLIGPLPLPNAPVDPKARIPPLILVTPWLEIVLYVLVLVKVTLPVPTFVMDIGLAP